MSATLGWALAVVGMALGYAVYGWAGVAMAVSVTVFWLLLQFSRAMRVMRIASGAPVGMVPSAVMLHAKLQKGQRLMDVILKTKSLGEKVAGAGSAAGTEVFVWRDQSDAQVTVTLQGGRVTDWTLQRPAQPADELTATAPADQVGARPNP